MAYIKHGLFDRVVDDGVIVIFYAADLVCRGSEALLYNFFCFGASAAQTLFKHL